MRRDPVVPPSHQPLGLSSLICAWLSFALILGQFLMAGLALFQDGAIWKCHVAAGFALALPIGWLLATALQRRARQLRWWAVAFAASYIIQILLVVIAQHGGPSILQALHPFTGALLLSLSLVILAKVGAWKAGPNPDQVLHAS